MYKRQRVCIHTSIYFPRISPAFLFGKALVHGTFIGEELISNLSMLQDSVNLQTALETLEEFLL